jgi:alpha-L-fucosidase 2
MLAFAVPGLIRLLPALPARWKRGQVAGLRCRGRVELAMEWDVKAKTLTAQLKSAATQTVTLRVPLWAGHPRSIKGAARLQPAAQGPQYFTLTLPAKRSVELRLYE